MSDSQTYEEIEVSSEGVTVLKRFEEEEFPVPAIAFELTSERDEPVTVRMVDTVPDSVAVEDLGFHPEYGSEHWTIEDDTITFERELEAEASFTTVYGIRATGTDDIKRFLTDPELADVDPPLPEDAAPGETAGTSGDDAVEDAISVEEEVPDVDEEEEDDAEAEEADEEEKEPVETIELNDPTSPGADDGLEGADAVSNGEAEPDSTDGAIEVDIAPDAETEPDDDGADADGGDGTEALIQDDEDEAGAPAGPAAVEGSLVSALAEEIRNGDVPEDDVEELREALDGPASGTGSLEARIERVQGDIADLRAYTDSLEEFLDENGTGQELIQDARTRLDDFAETVDRMDERIDETEDTVDRVETEVDDIGEEVSDVEADVEDVEDGLAEVETDLDGMGDRIDEVESDLSTLEAEVADEEIPARLADLEEEIKDLREWQTQIRETFGG